MSTYRPSSKEVKREIERLKAQKARRTRIAFFAAVLLVVVGAIFAIIYLARPVQVNGMSMEPTLLQGDLLLMDCTATLPEYGEVVVAKLSSHDDLWLVKRVIGLPGDEILVDSNSGYVRRNGEYLYEEYVSKPSFKPSDVEYPVVVPEGHVFLMGDNRESSVDSRSVEIGMVPLSDLVGRAWSSNRILTPES